MAARICLAVKAAGKPLRRAHIPFGGNLNKVPRAMTEADIIRVQNDFVATAKRALAAGFEFLELHAAHGYLFNEFLSPLTNQRTDQYGGSFENRIRFLVDTARAVRQGLAGKFAAGRASLGD